MKIHRFLSHALLVSGLAFVLTALGMAQDQPPDQPDDQLNQTDVDPPSRVARVNMVQGSVSFQPGGEGDWVSAVPNRPLTTGDNLWADQNSRAELHVGSTAIRLNSESSLTILELDDRTTQLKVSQGSVILRVRHIDDGDLFEVDTPNLAFNLQRTGEYRIDVSGDGNQTDVSVFNGSGEVTGGGYSYTVVGGQDARFTGSDQLNYDIEQIPQRDDFTNWAMDRDHREDGPESADYVSPEMTGYEDLDDYGHWTNVAGYGNVWAPTNVAADWAPYRNGHWVFVQPWGWTWVEDEPWGFAPFHYGRWAYAGSRWCWVPGPVVVRPVYAPALVAFVGGGGGFHLSVGVGEGVGWFPLGPGEVFVPGYRVSRGYVNNINVTNTRVNVTQITNVYNTYNSRTTNVTNITYVNQRVNNSVTVVSHDTFVNSRPVGRNIVRVDAREVSAAPVFHQVQGVQPVRQSVMGAGQPVRFQPPAAVINRKVVATRNPTPPRAPFEQRQGMNPVNNVRTEQPNNPQRLETGSKEAPRQPSQGMGNGQQMPEVNPRPQVRQIPRPNQPPVAAQQPQAQTPNNNDRNIDTRNTDQRNNNDQRNNDQRNNDQRDNMRPQPRNENSHVQVSPNQIPHPLVRPAPPVQEKSPQQQQNEERQFHNWDQQRRSTPPPAPPHNESKPQDHRSEDKHVPKPPNH